MKSLLIIAHGSRRAASNEEVRLLAERIARQPNCGYDEVSAAFLEIAEPSIPDGLELCIQRGATEVTVFPYFLAAGRHVVEDIPREIAPVVDKYPKVNVQLAPHLGMAAALPEVILSTTRKSQ
ncbi:sirohydrochlorin chelatase [Kaarinaea lacus]